jgi:hypothetical protein
MCDGVRAAWSGVPCGVPAPRTAGGAPEAL